MFEGVKMAGNRILIWVWFQAALGGRGGTRVTQDVVP